jgi:hypothetical protein
MTSPHAATPATAPQSPDDVLRQPPVVRSREQSTVVFCDDPEQVRAGFALALAVMQAHESLLIMSPDSDLKEE